MSDFYCEGGALKHYLQCPTQCKDCHMEENAMKHPLPANVAEAVQSAWASALEGELDGWEVALIERRMREAAQRIAALEASTKEE